MENKQNSANPLELRAKAKQSNTMTNDASSNYEQWPSCTGLCNYAPVTEVSVPFLAKNLKNISKINRSD